jgi:hypothetical protein
MSICNHGSGVLYLLADDIRRIFGHFDNTGLGFGGPSVLNSTYEKCRVEREDFTEPSEVDLFRANDESHEFLVDVRAGNSLEHDVTVS